MDPTRGDTPERNAAQGVLQRHTEQSWQALAQALVLSTPESTRQPAVRSLAPPTAHTQALWERSPNRIYRSTRFAESPKSEAEDADSALLPDDDDVEIDDFMKVVLIESGAFTPHSVTASTTSSAAGEERTTPRLNAAAPLFIPSSPTPRSATPPVLDSQNFSAPPSNDAMAPIAAMRRGLRPERFSQTRNWALNRLAQLEARQKWLAAQPQNVPV